MQTLIDYIQTAIAQTSSLEEALNFLPMSFKKEFPVAYVHSQTRLKDEASKEAFKAMLNEDGFTPNYLTQENLNFLNTDYPQFIQKVSYMCVKKEPKGAPFYTNKNTNDYWKKIKDVELFNAVFDIESIKDEKLCEAEFNLREVIRKRKEVHALKDIGYIYLAESTEDISEVFEHYFGKKTVLIDGKYYIGYAKRLRDINMRYFVCAPETTVV